MKNKYFFLILIVAFILRFWALGDIPFSLNWDENSNAYNAYSILKTGKDQYGSQLPLTNRSFDDFKPPLYMYLNVPTISIFGLTPFAARLPSALLGFLTVPLIYFLVKYLQRPEDVLQLKKIKVDLATISMALFAISPWSIQFSRVGFESNIGFFSTLLSITTFLYGLRKPKLLILSGLISGLTIYTYHAERIFLPLMLVAISFLFKEKLFSVNKKYAAAFTLLFILTITPLFLFTPLRTIAQRLETTAAESRRKNILESQLLIAQDNSSAFAQLIHNRRILMAKLYLDSYLLHFDPNFLFTKGDNNPRHHIEGMGMLYLFQLPLIIFGLYSLFRKRNLSTNFLLIWLIIAPIPAAPASPAPHALRSFLMLFPLTVITSYGLLIFFNSRLRLKKVLIAGLLLWIAYSILVYVHNYFHHYSKYQAPSWQYGYSQAVTETANLKDKFEQVLIDHSIEQAYIFWLFNLKYDPALFQASGNSGGFDKFNFDPKKPYKPDQLFVSVAKNFPGDFEVLKTIYYPDGSEAIKIGHSK